MNQLDRIEHKLDLVLTGPPGAPEKGMLVRVDRLEQSEKRRARRLGWFRGMIAANVVSIAAFIVYVIRRIPKP